MFAIDRESLLKTRSLQTSSMRSSLSSSLSLPLSSSLSSAMRLSTSSSLNLSLSSSLSLTTARTEKKIAAIIGRLAVRSLYEELALTPKPGLVSLIDNGSHHDMDARSFYRSLFTLRHYFVEICQAGMQEAPFAVLQQLAIRAEARMLQATQGVNTHRGAIFCLGMLSAAIAACKVQGCILTAATIQATLLRHWGAALIEHSHGNDIGSHGQIVAATHAVSGAREEAARGYPALFSVALPVFSATLAAGRNLRCAKVDTLFTLMLHIHDTNVYYRGGSSAAELVQQHAQAFIDAGSSAAPDWQARAAASHRCFVARGISPGGAADLLAATCLLHQVLYPGLHPALHQTIHQTARQGAHQIEHQTEHQAAHQASKR